MLLTFYHVSAVLTMTKRCIDKSAIERHMETLYISIVCSPGDADFGCGIGCRNKFGDLRDMGMDLTTLVKQTNSGMTASITSMRSICSAMPFWDV
jgi:hypothetical protein